MNSIEATREYREQLQGNLERSRRHLPAKDFAVVSPGLISEIGRLDCEIANAKFRAFMGCSDAMPLFPRVAQFVQRTCAKILIEENPAVSLEKKQIKEFPITSRNSGWSISLDSPSISMGAHVARGA